MDSLVWEDSSNLDPKPNEVGLDQKGRTIASVDVAERARPHDLMILF